MTFALLNFAKSIYGANQNVYKKIAKEILRCPLKHLFSTFAIDLDDYH